MLIHRVSERVEEGATSSSYNQGRRRVGGRENIKQAMNKRER